MTWSRLDTHAWNLSLGAAATSVLAACGPFVVLEGETDTDTETGSVSISISVSETDTNPPPNETDTTPPGGCNQIGCDPGYECIDDVCIPYDDYCNDGGCCYEGCCYGECYQCYSDEECGPQGLCEGYFYGCVYPEPLLECGGGPDIVPLDLPTGSQDEVVSLTFVDANGDAARDLVVGRNGSAQLHLGPEGAFPLTLPVPPGAALIDAASGDFDGDGDADIVASTAQSSLLMLTGDGGGGFSLTLDLFVGQPLRDLAVLQWNGDGTLDVAGVSDAGQAVLHLGDGNGGFVANTALPSFGLVYTLATTDYGGDAYGDLVLQDDVDPAQVFFGDASGDPNPDLYLPGTVHGERHMLAGPISEGTPYEVIGYTPKGSWMLLELWYEGIDGPLRFALDGDATWAEVGDLDGNGLADLVVGRGSTLQYVYGTNDPGIPWFGCQTTFFLGEQVLVLAVGDFDGNGRADVALANGGLISVLRTF